MDHLDGHACTDHLLKEPLAKAGWQAMEVSWHSQSVDWNDFEMVIIRSTWDYPNQSEEFLRVLESIDAVTHLENDLSIVRWNLEKTYLQELANQGVKIVPTKWGYDLNAGELEQFFDLFGTPEIILKPVISANANDTYRLDRDRVIEAESKFCEVFRGRRFMVQPFIDSILSEGELSLIYFGGKYSHAILKTPTQNDFRVQEDHGGIVQTIQPGNPELAMSQRVIDAIEITPLYARVDIVRIRGEQFALMELELIEPSLHFEADVRSIDLFIGELENRWQRLRP